MSSPEFPDVLEEQAETCFALTNRLIDKIAALEGSNQLIHRLEPLDFKRINTIRMVGRKLTLYFPFNSQINEESAQKYTWLVELKGRKINNDFRPWSTVTLSTARIGATGNINIDDIDWKYNVDTKRRDISSSDSFAKRIHSKRTSTKDGRLDFDDMWEPDVEEATNLRILLEDALEQVDS